ncbi:DUF6516 family protein [uncultured Lamprocystis sp.]|uniref:toxin-antitoxin system TumE family protein n=1 Tax=uncultured Lamprocystis sp. TaxID=543132 RepID=UPI0025F8A7EA|nr:DUF6516 family protein [uncultured Lamprocystis sp.]
MISPARYLEELKARLVGSAVVGQVSVVSERIISDQGYFRARITLTNGDFLEVSEYFVVQGEIHQTLEYRYQWMDANRRVLVRRWDNARHFPDLPGFPDHLHVGGEETVLPSRSMSILNLIDFLEEELA